MRAITNISSAQMFTSQQSLISVLSQQSLMSVLHAISRHHLQLHIRVIHGYLDLHKCHECPYAAEAKCNAKLYECDFTSKVNYIVYIEFRFFADLKGKMCPS